MPRFNPERWKPTDDSSPGCRTLDPHSVVLRLAHDAETGRMGCPCGCGEFPRGAKAVFAMGHDARLRGILIRAHLMGIRIRYYCDHTLGDPADPYDVAAQYAWRAYLDEAVTRREGRNREVLRRALGSERLVQVGRWEYTGQVVAVYRMNDEDRYRIEYVNKAGDVKTASVAASESPLATEGAAT
jgi:hypothetical protein